MTANKTKVQKYRRLKKKLIQKLAREEKKRQKIERKIQKIKQRQNSKNHRHILRSIFSLIKLPFSISTFLVSKLFSVGSKILAFRKELMIYSLISATSFSGGANYSRSEYEQAKYHYQTAVKQINKLNEEVKDQAILRARLIFSEYRFQRLQQDFRETGNQLSKVKEKLEEKETLVQDVSSNSRILERNLETANDHLKQSKVKYQNKIAKIKEKNKQRIAESERQLELLKSNLNLKENEIKELYDNLNLKETEIQELQKLVKENAKLIQNLQEKLINQEEYYINQSEELKEALMKVSEKLNWLENKEQFKWLFFSIDKMLSALIRIRGK